MKKAAMKTWEEICKLAQQKVKDPQKYGPPLLQGQDWIYFLEECWKGEQHSCGNNPGSPITLQDINTIPEFWKKGRKNNPTK